MSEDDWEEGPPFQHEKWMMVEVIDDSELGKGFPCPIEVLFLAEGDIVSLPVPVAEVLLELNYAVPYDPPRNSPVWGRYHD